MSAAESSDWDSWAAQFIDAEDAHMRAALRRYEDRMAAKGQAYKDAAPHYSVDSFLHSVRPPIDPSLDAVERMQRACDADVRWMRTALRDERRKWFVAAVARRALSFPEALFEPMLLAAIEEISASFNRLFIEPCLRVFGARPVHE